MSIRPRTLDRIRAIGPVPYEADDLLAVAGPRVKPVPVRPMRFAEHVEGPPTDRWQDDGGAGFGRTPAGGRLPALPTPPRRGDAAAELRALVVILEDLEAHALVVDRPGITVALAQARSAARRAGVL